MSSKALERRLVNSEFESTWNALAMDPRLQHGMPILSYPPPPPTHGMPPPPPLPLPGVPQPHVSDADLDKHMVAKGLARLPEPHTDADLDLLWRTLATEVSLIPSPSPRAQYVQCGRLTGVVRSIHIGRCWDGRPISRRIERKSCRFSKSSLIIPPYRMRTIPSPRKSYSSTSMRPVGLAQPRARLSPGNHSLSMYVLPSTSPSLPRMLSHSSTVAHYDCKS